MKRKTLGILIGLFSALAMFILSPRPAGSQPASHKAGKNLLKESDLIQTALPQRRNFNATRAWFGQVKTLNKTYLKALANGRIVSIKLHEGVAVKAEDEIMTLGGPLIENRFQGLQRQSENLEKRLLRAQKLLKVKQAAAKQQMTSIDQLNQVAELCDRLQNEWNNNQQRLMQLKSAVHIKAGTSGIFTQRQVAVGQDVSTGETLAEIITPEQIYIAATCFPPDGATLTGKTVFINRNTEKPLKATITTILPQRTTAGAQALRITDASLKQYLQPGETVAGTVVLAAHSQALALPQSAVVRDEKDDAFIFIRQKSGFRKKTVTTGLNSKGWVEIVSGITAADEVVISGAYELFYQDFNKIYKVVD